MCVDVRVMTLDGVNRVEMIMMGRVLLAVMQAKRKRCVCAGECICWHVCRCSAPSMLLFTMLLFTHAGRRR